jgi:hypothetical protein
VAATVTAEGQGAKAKIATTVSENGNTAFSLWLGNAVA